MKKSKIVLVTGGARSGKSSFAESLVRSVGEKRFYIATAPILDDEMRVRVRKHRELRAADRWTTIEEELDVTAALRRAAGEGAEGILVDCLTLWINNLLYQNAELDEDAMRRLTGELVSAARQISATVVLVINEVGLGLVPESALARRFRDLSGRCAQTVAAAADEVYFTVAGIARRIK